MKRKLTHVFLIILIIFNTLFTSCNYITNVSEETNNSIKDKKALKVHFIDVGQGDSILIEINGFTILIDAGPNSSSTKLQGYLNKNGIKNIDYVIATHPDEDHIGGMDEIIRNFDIGNFYAPKITKDTDAFKNMIQELRNKDLKINTATKDMSLNLGEDVDFDFLAPIEAKYEETNNYSVVSKLIYKETSIIFMGDAESMVESQLIRDKIDVDVDILKLGHHGSNSSTTKAFLDKVSPDYAVISCGKSNKYGHPHKEIIERLKKAKVNVSRTDQEGTIIITSDGNNIVKDQVN